MPQSIFKLTDDSINNDIIDFIRLIWWADMACSACPHYKKGRKRSWKEIIKEVQIAYTDDLVENLAAYGIRSKVPDSLSLTDLEDLLQNFYNIIKPYYQEDPSIYSPLYPILFSTRNISQYFQIICLHSNSGGAMRSGFLAYNAVKEDVNFALVAMSHLHPEAVSAAFAVYSAVNVAKKHKNIGTIINGALEGASRGDKKAKEFIIKSGGKIIESLDIEKCLEKVLTSKNPYIIAEDLSLVGIESYFVIPAAILVASESMSLSPRDALINLIEKAAFIGGDPDTIASIGGAILGAYFEQDIFGQIPLLIKEGMKMGLKLPTFPVK